MGRKTLLVLGASSDQLFVIRTAKEMGLRVLAVDMNPKSPGFALADDFAVVSTRDVPALTEFIDTYRANGSNIDGVLVMGSDIPQVVVALAEHLGTPHIPMEAALLSVHKYKMKRRFQEHALPVPWFQKVHSAKELKDVSRTRGFPLIIKPVDRSGSRGVFYLRDGCDLHALYEQSRGLSFCGEVMVEQFLEGIQLSTETVMYRGEAYTVGIADRNYEMLDAFAPNVIENGGWMPSAVASRERESIEKLVKEAALALGVTDGVVKGDIILTKEGLRIIEMATRMSGGDFSESLIRLSCGVNLAKAAIRIATGDTPDLAELTPKCNTGVVNRYFFPKPGRLIRIEGADEVRRQPWIKKLEFSYGPGDIVPAVHSHADRFGVFIAVGSTRSEAEERAKLVYETIRIVTE